MTSIETYRAALDPTTRAAIDALRSLVLSAAPDLTEEIKWNAPSFADDGQDRVTLGLNPKGGYRIVLHRGAKPLDASGFRFSDEAKLAKWPAPDRGVITLKDQAEIETKSAAITALVGRWIEATR
jgi:hypothetical protein